MALPVCCAHEDKTDGGIFSPALFLGVSIGCIFATLFQFILPDLNLKTETVLNLFKDVEYDLGKVRSQKVVKPIYFTQFPKDLDEIQSVKLKKETFIRIRIVYYSVPSC